ncbi:MAG: ArsA-related P-loop ATPase [Nakamurella sp.]
MTTMRKQTEHRPGAPEAERWPASARAARLHIVTGKGGTGKSTIAAALALALAYDGKRVLLVETEERQVIAQLFDLPPLPYEERRIAVAPGGGEVRALAIDVEAALFEYFAMFYNLGFAARSLKRLGAVEFATTLAPGLRDVLITGKIKETVTRLEKHGKSEKLKDSGGLGAFMYDAVVVDAPPTGRVVPFLNVTAAMADLARRGPIHSQATGVMSLMHSHNTCVHLVTLLEDMPVMETLEAAEQLRAGDLPIGSIIVNQVSAAHLPETLLADAALGTVDSASLRRGLASYGIDADRAALAGFADEIRRHAEHTAAEAECRTQLAATNLPMIDLPAMPDPVELGELYELAELLIAQGVSV